MMLRLNSRRMLTSKNREITVFCVRAFVKIVRNVIDFSITTKDHYFSLLIHIIIIIIIIIIMIVSNGNSNNDDNKRDLS